MSTATFPLTNTATFSLDHYEHMIACGAFDPPHNIPVELIRGKIVEKGTGAPAKFTLDHYEHMVAVGAFDPPYNVPVELVQGEMVMMSPIGPPHRHFLRLLTDWSYQVAPADRIAIHVQAPVYIPSNRSEPEPDLVWTPRRDYSQQHPKAEEVLLLIEVAESSLAYDRGTKLPVYAQADIPEYWIANLIDEQIEVYREPSGLSYRNKTLHRGNDPVHPLRAASRGAASVAIVRAVGTTRGAIQNAVAPRGRGPLYGVFSFHRANWHWRA